MRRSLLFLVPLLSLGCVDSDTDGDGIPDARVPNIVNGLTGGIIDNDDFSLPFLIVGSILLEVFFSIPGMGRTLITAIVAKDFPVVEYMSALFAAVVILTVILTDVLYAIFDPRVRLS